MTPPRRKNGRRPRPRGGVPVVVVTWPWYVTSAPPTRGCSPCSRRRTREPPVGPAHAGVFRGIPRSVGSPRSRPRPRGGVPRLVEAGRLACESAPPTRGCSGFGIAAEFGADVGPAHAGVFPFLDPFSTAPWSSAPPTRGCSAGRRRQRAAVRVGPAHAGVFRRRRCRRPLGRCRPRPRGGVPRIEGTEGTDTRSAPPTRGCSPSHVLTLLETDVGPAHAGVFRCASSKRRSSWSRPRPRGGVPELAGPSPPCGVGPAHAGVFQRPEPSSRRRRRRPRPRGGVPDVAGWTLDGYVSAPPTRGCSVAARLTWCAMSVGPAHAGVFPCAHARGFAVHSRPRPRGGVPVPGTVPVPPMVSAPPTRGCSGDPLRVPVPQRVGPAHAGVFP